MFSQNLKHELTIINVIFNAFYNYYFINIFFFAYVRFIIPVNLFQRVRIHFTGLILCTNFLIKNTCNNIVLYYAHIIKRKNLITVMCVKL